MTTREQMLANGWSEEDIDRMLNRTRTFHARAAAAYRAEGDEENAKAADRAASLARS